FRLHRLGYSLTMRLLVSLALALILITRLFSLLLLKLTRLLRLLTLVPNLEPLIPGRIGKTFHTRRFCRVPRPNGLPHFLTESVSKDPASSEVLPTAADQNGGCCADRSIDPRHP